MRFRAALIATVVMLAAGSLAACGGGGGSVSPPVGSSVGSLPTPAAASQVIGPAGGTATLAGASGTLTAKFPAGAFGSSTTVTLTAYTSTGQMRPATAVRHGRFSIPTNGYVFLGGFAIDTGTAGIYAPVTVTVPIVAPVPTGDVVRVARYGTNGLADVDTATVSGTSVSNDVNKAYVSVSNGGVANPYIVYAVPANVAATPAPIAITVAPASGSGPLVIGTTQNFVATGSADGNPLAFSPAFSVSGVANTATAGSNPATETVAASTQGGALTIKASDARTGATGSGTFTVLTQRPANAGDTFAFSGTLNRVDTYSYPANNPLPSTNVSAAVTQAVTVNATPNPYGAGTAQDFTVNEADAYPSQTQSAKTDYFYTLSAASAGSSQFQLLGYKATDESNNVTSVQYATPAIVDQLPETASASWTNSPALSLNETTAAGDTITRTVNADGSYTETDHLYGSGTNYPSVSVAMQENSDGSGSVKITKYETNGPFGYPAGTLALTNYFISAPTPNTVGLPQLQFTHQSYVTTGTPAPITQYAVPSAVWYPLNNAGTINAIYSETDANNGALAILASCNVPSAFGTSANQLVQSISSVDTVLGTLTTTTTTQWVVSGFGPVCVQVASDVQAFYNYNNDTTRFGPVFQAQLPQQETKIAETLTLQSTGTTVSAQTATRKTAAANYAPIAPGAIAVAKVQLAQLVQRDRLHRLRSFARHLINAQGGRQ